MTRRCDLRIMLALAVTLAAGLAATDSVAGRSIDQWAHRTWTAQEGAPTEIRSLAQTRDGYLWLGTASGLVRFDGVRFVPFAPRGTDAVPAIGVSSLLAANDGTLWIVWETGAASHLVAGRLTNYGAADGLGRVYQLAESSRGDLVAGTSSGVVQFVRGGWSDVRSAWGFTGAQARAVWFDREDALWVETESRMLYRPARETRFVDPGLPLIRIATQADFAQSKDGTIWMAELARSAHVLRRVGDNRPETEVAVGAWALLVDRKGSLWIGSRGDGLRRVRDPSRIAGRRIAQFGPEAEQYTERDGLLSNVITDLLEDREGSIWVASSRGLERFREGSLIPYSTRGGLRARAVFASRDSSVWISAYAVQQLTRIGPRGRDDLYEPPCWCSRMVEDSAGAIWGFGDTALVRFDGLKPTRFPLRGGPLRAITAIAIDRSGTVWLADQALGLTRVIGNRLDPVISAKEIGHTNALFADERDRIWMAGEGKVTRYDHGKVTSFGSAEGVEPGQISDFYVDRADHLLAVGAGGIHRFENGRFRTLTRRQALPGTAALGITEDDSGAWWVATRVGLLRLAKGELDSAFADSTHTLSYRIFDRLDGLPGALAMSGVPMLTRSADGKIWVAADEGAASVDPREISDDDVPLHVLVETVRIDGTELAPADVAEVPAGTNNLEIDYTATTLAMAERVRFRYRLEGVDRAWQNVGNRRRAYYTDLGPGSYRFRVAVSTGDGRWVDSPDVWSFRILPAWYQSGWFIALAIVLIGGIGGALAAFVQRRRYRRSQAELEHQYEAVMAERARIADDLHDTLLQGFTGVNLQLIAAELSIRSQSDDAGVALARVQRLTEDSLREARERVWEMRDAALTSGDLATALETIARDRTASMAIEVVVTSAGSRRRLPPTLEDAAFRIGREAIVNAIRHAQAGRIEIHLEFRPTSLSLEVRDDGRGLNPQEVADARNRGHFGLTGIQNRASLLGGRCDVRPRPGRGTVVSLELPITQVQSVPLSRDAARRSAT